jgi:hypothetical protein
MTFSWAQFETALATAIPTIGQIVAALHPGNAAEADKIATGTTLISGMLGALGSLATAPTATPAPSPPVAAAAPAAPAATK